MPTNAHTGLIVATIEEGRDVVLSEANVLVVDSHSNRRVRHLAFGSTSDYMHHARCSVLLVLPRVAGEATGDAATGEPETETHEDSSD